MRLSIWVLPNVITTGRPNKITKKNKIIKIHAILINQIVKGSIKVLLSVSKTGFSSLFDPNIIKFSTDRKNKLLIIKKSSILYTSLCQKPLIRKRLLILSRLILFISGLS